MAIEKRLLGITEHHEDSSKPFALIVQWWNDETLPPVIQPITTQELIRMVNEHCQEHHTTIKVTVKD